MANSDNQSIVDNFINKYTAIILSKKIQGSTLIIIGIIILLILFSLFLKINISQQQKRKVTANFTLKVKYTNPFEKKTQYTNPFDEYQNPIDDLVFAQTQ